MKKHPLDLKAVGRDRSMEEYLAFVRERAPGEIAKMNQKLSPSAVVRIICVRHGMGHHNDAFEV